LKNENKTVIQTGHKKRIPYQMKFSYNDLKLGENYFSVSYHFKLDDVNNIDSTFYQVSETSQVRSEPILINLYRTIDPDAFE